MALKLDTLKRALHTLEEAIELYKEQQVNQKLQLALQDSVIQRFEYTYELAWKTMKRWISDNVNPESAEPTFTRKEPLRLAARQGLIEDPLRWFDYHEARAVSAHTYNEANADQAFQAALALVGDVQYLIDRLEKHND